MTTIMNHFSNILNALRRRSRIALTVLVTSSLALSVTTSASLADASTKKPLVKGALSSSSALPKVKHVWYIIMENKSYDATFSGLNNNTYLCKTLPSQGTLRWAPLKHYVADWQFVEETA